MPRFLPLLLVVHGLACTGGEAGADGDHRPAVAADSAPAPTRVTFISGGGSVTTFDVADDSVIDAWNITESPTLGAVDEPRWDGQPIEGFAHDPRRRVVFLVLPDRARESPDVGKYYRIVAASLPRLERVATFAFADSATAQLVFDPVNDRLIAQAVVSESLPGEARPGWRLTTVTLASPSLEERARTSQHVPNVFDGSHSAPFLWDRMAGQTLGATQVSRDGRWLINRLDLIDVGPDSLTARRHDASMAPADSVRIAASAGAVPGRFGYVVRAAGARRLLLQVTLWPDSVVRPTHFIALRGVGADGERLPLAEVPAGIVTLLDDERHVLVQDVDGPLGRPSSQVNLTGRIFIYDAERGTRVLEIDDPRLAGRVSSVIGPICSTADLSRIYFRLNGGSIGVLRPRTRDLVVPRPEALGHPSDLCIFD